MLHQLPIWRGWKLAHTPHLRARDAQSIGTGPQPHMDLFTVILTAAVVTSVLSSSSSIDNKNDSHIEKILNRPPHNHSVRFIGGLNEGLGSKRRKLRGKVQPIKNRHKGKIQPDQSVWWPWQSYEEWSLSRKHLIQSELHKNDSSNRQNKNQQAHRRKGKKKRDKRKSKKKKSMFNNVTIHTNTVSNKLHFKLKEETEKGQHDDNHQRQPIEPRTFKDLPTFELKYNKVTKRNFTADYNECLVDNGGCEGLCINTIGSYKCHCPEGFRLDPYTKNCKDINECILRNGHGPCQGECYNKWGSFSCGCQSIPGTELSEDGISCKVVDSCAKEQCSHMCINTRLGAFCACPQGFVLSADWKNCVDVDECLQTDLQSPPCKNNCTNTNGSYICH